MKKLYFLFLFFICASISFGQDMIITGAFDGPLTGGKPKVVELYVINDIADLSLYGFGSANNGGGSDGEELTFTGSASAGDFIYITDSMTDFNTYFGFDADFESNTAAINGDDALELFYNGSVIDTFGDINTSGTGEAWEYLDGWAYRVNSTGPDGSSFVLSNWFFSGVDAVDGCTTNDSCASVFPIGTFTYSGTPSPILSITSPANGSTVTSPDVDIELNVLNFVVGTSGSGADGHIHYSVDGGSTVMKYDTDPIELTGLADGSHTVDLELVDNSHNSLDPAVTASVTFTVASVQTVANLGELRAGTVGNVYQVTGEVIVTFVTGSSRNQLFIEDATAGMLIDDPSGTITTAFSEGDGITGLEGQLGEYAGVLQFVPSVDPGAASSTGNIITPQVVTINDLTNDIDTYESELVTINDVTFEDGDGSATFASGTNYNISDSTGGPFVFRTSYPNDNMVGEEIPTGAITITVIAGEFNGTPQVYPRNPDEVLSVDQIQSNVSFGLYPNPTSTGFVNISSSNSDTISVAVYDVLGKQVLSSKVIDNTLNVSNLNSGVYILKITQGNASTTKKLVIK